VGELEFKMRFTRYHLLCTYPFFVLSRDEIRNAYRKRDETELS